MNWNSHSRNPVALIIMPWLDGPGVTIAKLDADGTLYGCRDVTHGEHFDSIVAAWKADAASQGLPVEYHDPAEGG